jgi:radical SAM superfamily enzyme YgiQ (UPF0313 family)
MIDTIKKTSGTGVSDETLCAFDALIKNLKIKKPREIVLINPQLVPDDVFDPVVARNRGYYAFPPVGLLYLAAVARHIDPTIEIKILDLNYELLKRANEDNFTYNVWQDLLQEVMASCKAPYVGVTCMFGTTKPLFLAVSKFIREHYPNAPIMAGGVQATYDANELLENNYCDILFKRESESQFALFLERVVKDNKAVPWGSAFQNERKVFDLGAPSDDPPVNWDIRPFYDLIEIKDYYKYGSLAAFSRYNGEDKPFATVLSNRGCRARCTFCTVRDFNGFGVRGRDVQDVIDEIKFLVHKKGIRQIDWLDDDLLFDPPRAIELFKGLTTQVPELEWISNNGLIAAAISDEIMDWMVKSGMKAFKIGIESGNDDMLHKIKKPTTKVKLKRARYTFRKYPQVFVSANFIIGFPNEKFSQMLDTYNFANDLQWDWSSFYICQPLKGTEMFSAFQEMGDERADVENYDKTLNPGRSATRGEFGYKADVEPGTILTGRDIFKFPIDEVPSQEQLKEIWFTFNLIANFLENPNFMPDGSPEKIVRWFDSIAHAYPNDASMCAALAKGHKILGHKAQSRKYKQKFISIVSEFSYWQRRVKEFPELLGLADTPESAVVG